MMVPKTMKALCIALIASANDAEAVDLSSIQRQRGQEDLDVNTDELMVYGDAIATQDDKKMNKAQKKEAAKKAPKPCSQFNQND